MPKLKTKKTLSDRLHDALNAGSLTKARNGFYKETYMLVRKAIREQYREELKQAIRPCRAPEGHLDDSQCWTGTPVLAAFSAMEALHNGHDFQRAEEEIHRYGMDGIAASFAANIVDFYSPRGKGFRKYWDRK